VNNSLIFLSENSFR